MVEGNEKARAGRVLLHALWRWGPQACIIPAKRTNEKRTNRPGSSQSPGQQQGKTICSALIGQREAVPCLARMLSD